MKLIFFYWFAVPPHGLEVQKSSVEKGLRLDTHQAHSLLINCYNKNNAFLDWITLCKRSELTKAKIIIYMIMNIRIKYISLQIKCFTSRCNKDTKSLISFIGF